MKNIAFIIVTFKPDMLALLELINCIRPHRCIVVDNGETNTHGLDGVVVLHNQKNLGYGGGANVGILKAKEYGCSWYVVVNQDVRVSKPTVSAFVQKLSQISVGIVGPVMGTLDPKRWTTILGSKAQGERYVSGSWFAIHRDVIINVGMFYESYFLYYEEVDLCMRTKKRGFALTQVPLLGFVHNETTSLEKGSLVHQYYLARNHLLFVQRCAPWQVKLYELARLPKTIMEHRSKSQSGALMGVRDYLLQRFGPMKESL